MSDEIKLIKELALSIDQLLAIVRIQNGNKHDDINKIQADAQAARNKVDEFLKNEDLIARIVKNPD